MCVHRKRLHVLNRGKNSPHVNYCGLLRAIFCFFRPLSLVTFHVCSYEGRGQEEHSQLVGPNHHLRVVLLQCSPGCFGQVRTGTQAQERHRSIQKDRPSRLLPVGFPLSGSYLVTRNQASSAKSGDSLMYVLMCGMARLLPAASAFHRLNTQMRRFQRQRSDMLQAGHLLEEGVKPQLPLGRLDAVGKRASS